MKSAFITFFIDLVDAILDALGLERKKAVAKKQKELEQKSNNAGIKVRKRLNEEKKKDDSRWNNAKSKKNISDMYDLIRSGLRK